MAIFSIQDEGHGMTQTQQAQLFQKYQRVTDEKATISGTGLGLYVVKLIVDAHGGKIEVSSEPGKGSIFSVTLPLKVVNINQQIISDPVSTQSL